MRLLREPLFHFLVLGVAVFAFFYWQNPPAAEAQEEARIVVDVQDAARLAERFRSTRGRAPSEAEMQRIVDGLVREEVLVREARALGLDRGDGVVRNRLAQKMEFLAASLAQSMVPDEDALVEHMNDHMERFETPGRLAFDQIALEAGTDAVATLAQLEQGADPAKLGAPSLLPVHMPLSIETAVDGTFGNGVFEAISKAPVERWFGPVVSGYGQHLVRVTEYQPPALPPFEEIREDVLLDWRRTQLEALTQAQLETLKGQYEIVLPQSEELAEWLLQ